MYKTNLSQEPALNKFKIIITIDSYQIIDLSIFQGRFNTRIYAKRHVFFSISRIFLFLDDNVPLALLYGAYISQLVRFVGICNNV